MQSPRVTDGAKLRRTTPMHDQSSVRFRGTVPLPADLIGAAPSVQRAADVARRAADSDDSVLIVAEAGFCPDGIARSIHQASPRAAEPFITIDCADDHGAVLQRLFGTERPARVDYEVALGGSALAEVGRGTILLSDVSEMPAGAQLRMSRLLRDGELRVRRTMAAVQFRVMASAAPSLEADVHHRRFRPELYRRLQRLRVDVPPLRDRAVDLPAVIDAALGEICRVRQIPCTLAPAARTALAALRWAGNLDELRGALGRLVDRCVGGMIRQEDVLADLQQRETHPRGGPAFTSLREARQTFERDYIASVLESSGWRMTDAARILGIERANLYRKTRQLGITRLKPRQ
jgi:DNA-binding NtrC family response regulator